MKMREGDTLTADGEFTPGDFPVESFREAAPHLRRPFAPNALRWRIVTGNTLVAYVDARSVVERLNLVVPHLWTTAFEEYGGRIDSKHVICHLTIDGLTRSDIGKESKMEGPKGARSDALKRAGVHFGIGVSLYAMKRIDLNSTADGSLDSNGIPTLKNKELTPRVEEWLRDTYAKWLDTDRGKHFGSALDHGDEPDSIGDVDADPLQPSETEDDLALAAKREEAERVYDETMQDTAKRRKMPKGKFKAKLEGCESGEQVDELIEELKAL